MAPGDTSWGVRNVRNIQRNRERHVRMNQIQDLKIGVEKFEISGNRKIGEIGIIWKSGNRGYLKIGEIRKFGTF